ncbi:conserved Plasmodium protein, unknown function [Plasmodium knowlesi strain H]|uniref:Uncharacterized protein n=3 Tax=Plasmodium knowlesi TaxID=5850 RepID=A0A5K1VLU9_PLAKH|nr:conserved Plasmodium protein, unknown function [Plasmodium knowlesi strain H]OTN65364.1 Uncharacterized protein PKNOH_S110098800 [Plasmodium knowlesi]CAA9989607.1 conserved Plasmodium protein, unknown function [Plasmodium knowlesi strain H]SBO22679.1 conserved Plasmodium protein, unknown function [Plasmodium knowlesi strain H]SBO23298.1 conserved Plasmodium protein, unknown function [Plasmodium knowlesi strain H]VVS79081.1 conserved Plasmodium protein, unknown function [Plasmodium knowlesi |eukprot:XP_002260333.1 hypothetical protein, conserved in Plasmodium species [Plasmodium knowlesi strain H]
MESSFNTPSNRFVLVSLRSTLNRHNINFVEEENTYNSEILKKHLKDLKQLKEDIIRKRNQSKQAIRNHLESFFISDGDRSCNFDVFYDKCLNILTRYLYAYKEINDILLGKNVDDGRKVGSPGKGNKSPGKRSRGSKSSVKSEEQQNGEDSNSLLYDLINKKLLIYRNKFLFDYDDDSEIYTSSEEEILIEGRPLKKKNKRDRASKSYSSVDNTNENDPSARAEMRETQEASCRWDKRERKGKVVRKCEKRKIHLLNRYPTYLRDLIQIVKIAKNREKKNLQISFLNKYGDDVDRNKMNILFNKLYFWMCYMNNKTYIEKKKKRMLYRIVRHNMLKHFYKNHDIFLEKLIKKKNAYNNLSVENVKKLFLSHECSGNSSSGKSTKECKVCKEKMKMLFYVTIYDNLNYSSLFDNLNVMAFKERNLLTNLLVNKKEKRKTINVNYDISFHADKHIYILSKNDIFCDVLHENYLKNNFNDLLQRIKDGSKGYNLLYIIFNKYKHRSFLNLKKIKKYFDGRNSSTSSRTGNGSINSMSYKGDCLSLRDSYYDILKSNIIKDENNSSIFFDKLFHSFHNVLYGRMYNTPSRKNPWASKRKDIELLNVDGQNSDSDDFMLIDSADGFVKEPSHKSTTNFMMQVKHKKVQQSSMKELQQKYVNVKRMKDIDDRYIEDGAWQNNTHSSYHYMECVNKKGGFSHYKRSAQGDEECNGLGAFERYLNKINEEVAIVVNSDDSDDDILCSHGKEKMLLNYLKGKTHRSGTEIGYKNESITLERSKVGDLKKNTILHPLINSKCIGFKINVNDIANRNLDVYCINNEEYVKAYKNTISYLKNQITPEMKKNYTEFQNIRNKIMKKEMKVNAVNDLLSNKGLGKNPPCYINSGQTDGTGAKKNNTVTEYIVVIEENVQEERYKIDIYNHAELTAYIVNSKEEKKREFYWNFIRNEIYSHKWMNKLQFKIQNYSNMYLNSFFKKNHLRSIKEYLYGLIINLYYQNIYDSSLNIQLSKHYGHYDPTKEYVLKNIHQNLNDLYQNVIKCIQSDILSRTCFMDMSRITGEKVKCRINDYLMNYRWLECQPDDEAKESFPGERKKNIDDMICKYRTVLLYYLLYIYPKFLHILNIIQIKNFKEQIKNTLPEKDDQHVQDAQKDFTSQKKMLKKAKNNHADVLKKEEGNENPIDFYLPVYVKNEKNILSAFDLSNILLANFNDNFEKTLFQNVLSGMTKMESVKDEMHPACLKTMEHFVKNTSYSIRKRLTNSQLAMMFAVLNAYLCFATVQHSLYFNAEKLGKFLLHKNSKIEIERYGKLTAQGKSYFPIDFRQRFLETFLLKKDQSFIASDKLKCKLMIYILLIQLCLMDNALPVQLTLINRNTAALLTRLNFSIVNKSHVTFNLNA